MSKIASHVPRHPRPPFVPQPEAETLESLDSVVSILAIPLPTRLSELRERADERTSAIAIDDGATSIADRATFETLSHRDDVPGAIGVREVKYLVSGVDTDTPQIYFLNTNRHAFHYSFARNVLNVPLTVAEFNRVTYFTEQRRFLAGTILSHESFQQPDGTQGLYALEFWPTDPVRVNFAALAFELASAAMPFAGNLLAYHPSGATQEELFEEEQQEFEQRGVQTVSTDQIFSNLTYSPLNLGVGFGKVRVIDGASPQPPSITDVVIFKTLPNDLSHVAGVLSEEPQTPLSHINLKAKQNNTPNAYLKAAATDPRIVPLVDSIVRFEVAPDDIRIRAATQTEMEEFLEEQRPDEPQFPPRNLNRTEIADLDQLGHDDLESVGAKAANVAELRSFLDSPIVPDGFAVPFYFYDRFMTEHGFYEEIRTIIAAEDFINSAEIREQRLKDIRRFVKRADAPTDLRDALGDMHAKFPVGTTPRCRSSTNNEDLVGFNGAGLYDSFTHREDEGHIEKSIKQVWASLWNFRAFEEREFYRIDHFQAAMGVLVHPNFDDERANGVALTKNIYFPGFAGFYINVQVGEALITNPDPNAIPAELLIMEDVDLSTPQNRVYETIRIRRSSLVEPGESVLTDDQVADLTVRMESIQAHFLQVYVPDDPNAFAMDLEFKIDKDDQLVIKQARPWVD